MRQDKDSFTFRDLDYVNLWGLSAVGAPAYDESAIFIIRGKGLPPPIRGSWCSSATRIDKGDGRQNLRQLRQGILAGRPLPGGGRPSDKARPHHRLKVWKDKALQIGAFIVLR